MPRKIELSLPPELGLVSSSLEEYISNTYCGGDKDFELRILQRSIDCRQGKQSVKIKAEIFAATEPAPEILTDVYAAKNVRSSQMRIVIVGAGPAGLFAALECIEQGIKPIILERGKPVQARRRDLANINKNNIVNPDSNYCFGEGGAGTYSDGKLYTRSTKRGNVRKILETLVAHGARQEILYDTHPHIGTNKLPRIVTAIRETIEAAGGEVHFDTKVIDYLIQGDEIKGVITSAGNEYPADAVILATGHSARDVYEKLHERGITIEAKPFAMGVRVEHPQGLIDKLQYHLKTRDRGEFLPAASYSLVTQSHTNQSQRGVFSFCMCPGGFIVPSATEQNELVVNGMSPSKRDSKFANSGIVVATTEADWQHLIPRFGPLAALELQREFERKIWDHSGGTQTSGAQRITDFLRKEVSSSLPDSSYIPGLTSIDFNEALPKSFAAHLAMGFRNFDKGMKGFITDEAVMVGAESRTSAPVRIPRDTNSLEHISFKKLYPCGEGAGYAGGIISAAIDGVRCAAAACATLSR